MKLKFVNANNKHFKYNASISSKGKLNFTADSIRYMKLDQKKYFNIALDVETNKFEKIFLVESKTETDITASVYKAGKYFYLDLSLLLDTLKFEYKNKVASFEISIGETKYEGSELFILSKVETKNKIKKLK